MLFMDKYSVLLAVFTAAWIPMADTDAGESWADVAVALSADPVPAWSWRPSNRGGTGMACNALVKGHCPGSALDTLGYTSEDDFRVFDIEDDHASLLSSRP
jgi:hypothetical protein